MPLIQDTLTYFGLPAYSSAAHLERSIVLFGAASELGSSMDGSRNGPFFTRRLSQAYSWQSNRPELIDLRARSLRLEHAYDAGDLVPDRDLAAYHQEVEAFVSDLPDGAVPIAIGGDHSVTLPLVSAVRRATRGPVTVIVFDHHLDLQFWAPDLDPPYNTNVMSHVAKVVGDGRLVHLGVAPVQTVSAAVRPWFLALLERIGAQVPVLSPELNCNTSVAEAVGRGQDVYISIDVDVLAQSEISSTGYPSDVGMPLSRVVELVRLVAANNRIVGCDLVEFAAARESRSKTTLSDAARACALILELVLAAASRIPRHVKGQRTNAF